MNTQKEQIKAVAEEICHLASLGGNLHPNDIIPDIEKLLASQRETLAVEIEGLKKTEEQAGVDVNSAFVALGYSKALTDAAAHIRKQ